MNIEPYLRIPCPHCKAGADEKCIDLDYPPVNGKPWRFVNSVHIERQRAGKPDLGRGQPILNL